MRISILSVLDLFGCTLNYILLNLLGLGPLILRGRFAGIAVSSPYLGTFHEALRDMKCFKHDSCVAKFLVDLLKSAPALEKVVWILSWV